MFLAMIPNPYSPSPVMDRRLRVLRRFAEFCLTLVERVLFQSGHGDLTQHQAITRISYCAMRLFGYVENPVPEEPRIVVQKQSTTGGNAPKSALQRLGHEPMTNTASPAEAPRRADEPGGYMHLADRLSAKVTRMIKRDQRWRFGPATVCYAGPEDDDDIGIIPDNPITDIFDPLADEETVFGHDEEQWPP
ncbi:MAG: hypothetical protein AAF199_05820 [Pseudomonadota bacterium]